MTINISTLLGGVDLNEIIGNVEKLRTLGPIALGSLRDALRNAAKNDPAVQALLAALENVLDPILRISPEEIARLDSSRHSINIRVSHDYPRDDEPPPPPPPPPLPTGILDSDPGMQAFPKDVYVTTSQPFKYLIHSGRVGDPVPSQFSPPIPGVDEPGWHILHNSQRP